jgi:sRNA-binding regulator protein Hfq
MIPRKLIRPSLKNVMGTKKDEPSKTYKAKPSTKTYDSSSEVLPPERTNHEADYYQELIKNKTPLIVLLKDGNKIEGHLEYYDKTFLRITREDQPNAFIYKTDIKYFTEA